MTMTTIFSVALGSSNHKEILPAAHKLFEYEDLFKVVDHGGVGTFLTTLQRYDQRKPAELPDDPAVDVIKAAIMEEVRIYATEMGYAVDSYDFEIVNLWMNIMSAGVEHKGHSHYGHTFSGCIYVQVPENSGLIKFYNPAIISKYPLAVASYTPHVSDSWTLEVNVGDILVWESHLAHEVPTLTFDGKRLSMAFDVDLYFKELSA